METQVVKFQELEIVSYPATKDVAGIYNNAEAIAPILANEAHSMAATSLHVAMVGTSGAALGVPLYRELTQIEETDGLALGTVLVKKRGGRERCHRSKIEKSLDGAYVGSNPVVVFVDDLVASGETIQRADQELGGLDLAVIYSYNPPSQILLKKLTALQKVFIP